MDVLVVGGTGVAGRATVEALVKRGYGVRVLSRSGRTDGTGATGYAGDLQTGQGLAEALKGVDAVVDAANIATNSAAKAKQFFVGGTRRLVETEAAAGVKHHVLLSIVAIDDVPFGYYQAKVAQEAAVAAGSVPATIVRTTQFHDLAGQLIDRMKVGPLLPIPTMTTWPVAIPEVGEALADAIEAGPPADGGVQRAEDLRGPRKEQMVSMVRRLLHAKGQRALVVPVPLPGKAGRAFRSGALGATNGGRVGRQTFDQWLAATAPSLPR